MTFRTLYPNRAPVLSIEIFPPKTAEGLESLKKKLSRYGEFNPDFISVTYGAGGSTRAGTAALASQIQTLTGRPAAAHITCRGQTRDELRSMLDGLHAQGVRHVVALRGDEKTPGDFRYASELIAFIKQDGRFGIACAGYPEGHIEATTRAQDIGHLKAKVDGGAEIIITQFFLDNYFFLRFRDEIAKAGIYAPLVAGILPISNFNQITKFSIMCGCTIPARVMRGLNGRSDADQEKFGLDHAAAQVAELVSHGVEGVHIYALNKKTAVERLAPLVRGSRNG